MPVAVDWTIEAVRQRHTYAFSWLGRPIIQMPADIVAVQELIWRVKPDLIVETGIAHGGSLVLYASILELLGSDRLAVGIDVEIRPHNREALDSHPMRKRIHLIERSSTDPEAIEEVRRLAKHWPRVMVMLDSNHTHGHVLRELELFSPLVPKGSYLIAMDTIVEDFPARSFPDRPWDKGNNPKTAVREFLKTNRRFRVDHALEDKLLISSNPEGFLECIAD